MNFIKKKLKGHKKDDEEEEYEKAMYEQSLHGGEKMKNTEEWQFFQQLSMKVQDTVQKTQTTLNKLKDIRQDSVTGKDEDDFYGLGTESSQDFMADNSMSYSAGKIPGAPPRPPPPSGEKFPEDSDFQSDTAMRAPPRPPPPPSGADMHPFSDSAFQGMPAKGSPARPPPPAPAKPPAPAVPFASNFLDQSHLPMSMPSAEPSHQALSLLDEFGFKQEEPVTVSTSAKANFQDLLFLDMKEEVDPFDTSFADVTNICTTQPSNNGDASESASNPFAFTSNASYEGGSKKSATNPFCLADDVAGNDSQTTDSLWFSHNPFSSSNADLSSQNNDVFIPNLLSDDGGGITNDAFSDPTLLSDQEVPNAMTSTVKSNILELDDIFSVPDSSNLDPVLQWPDSGTVGQGDSNLYDAPDSNITADTNKMDESDIWASDAPSTDVKNNGFPNYSISTETAATISMNHKEELANDTNVMDFFESESTANDHVMEPVTSFNSTVMNGHNQDDVVVEEVKEIEQREITPKEEDTEMSFSNVDKYEPVTETYEEPKKEDSKHSLKHEAEVVDASEEIQEIPSETIEANVSVSNGISNEPVVNNVSTFKDSSEPFTFTFKAKQEEPDQDFDAFCAKFESSKGNSSGYDPFSSGRAPSIRKIREENLGFGSMDEFDPFKISKRVEEKPVLLKEASRDSFEEYDNEADFTVVIKPKVKDASNVTFLSSEPPKLLPPPPKTPTKAFDSNNALRFNPFDKDFVGSAGKPTLDLDKVVEPEVDDEPIPALGEAGVRKADSIESPLTPLFDEDTSMPLETFPKPYPHEGWEMVLRQPNKKKLTGNRFWKKIFAKLSENSVLQLFNKADDKLPFQELPLQACYSLSEIGAQQYDQYGKIFTVKLQYKFYRERVGVRPGQISKVTQGQITSMGDVARLGLPLQHSPQTSQLLKMGTHLYPDIKCFIQAVEDALFRLVVHRDRVLTYKTEEIQVVAQDEFYVEQSKTGHVEKQLARVRIFFLAFITGMPSVEVGLNDINRQGKEVVGRYDILPVVTEEWIRLEDWEFHACVLQEEFRKTRIIKFHPPDASLFELLRFRIRPPKNRELPLQVRVIMSVTSSRVEIRSDILVPGYSSRKQGQIPCENIQIRFPIPECWIYLFRTEKHFRYGSKKSTARRPGKIKGLERIIGAAQNLDPSLIEVSAGQAKYEHVFHAVVWRIPRLPKEGQGAYTQQLFLLRTELTAFDQIPESFEPYVDVEFTMPATYVSHTTVRSVSVSNQNPPEKYVRYVSKHEYKVEIDFKSGDDIDGLGSSSSINNVPVTTTTTTTTTTTSAIQESTDEKEEDSD